MNITLTCFALNVCLQSSRGTCRHIVWDNDASPTHCSFSFIYIDSVKTTTNLKKKTYKSK